MPSSRGTAGRGRGPAPGGAAPGGSGGRATPTEASALAFQCGRTRSYA
eukprot:SAG11_NODE_27481_length_332_cov_0.798283_1_plen_47_part_10